MSIPAPAPNVAGGKMRAPPPKARPHATPDNRSDGGASAAYRTPTSRPTPSLTPRGDTNPASSESSVTRRPPPPPKRAGGAPTKSVVGKSASGRPPPPKHSANTAAVNISLDAANETENDDEQFFSPKRTHSQRSQSQPGAEQPGAPSGMGRKAPPPKTSPRSGNHSEEWPEGSIRPSTRNHKGGDEAPYPCLPPPLVPSSAGGEQEERPPQVRGGAALAKPQSDLTQSSELPHRRESNTVEKKEEGAVSDTVTVDHGTFSEAKEAEQVEENASAKAEEDAVASSETERKLALLKMEQEANMSERSPRSANARHSDEDTDPEVKFEAFTQRTEEAPASQNILLQQEGEDSTATQQMKYRLQVVEEELQRLRLEKAEWETHRGTGTEEAVYSHVRESDTPPPTSGHLNHLDTETEQYTPVQHHHQEVEVPMTPNNSVPNDTDTDGDGFADRAAALSLAFTPRPVEERESSPLAKFHYQRRLEEMQGITANSSGSPITARGGRGGGMKVPTREKDDVIPRQPPHDLQHGESYYRGAQSQTQPQHYDSVPYHGTSAEPSIRGQPGQLAVEGGGHTLNVRNKVVADRPAVSPTAVQAANDVLWVPSSGSSGGTPGQVRFRNLYSPTRTRQSAPPTMHGSDQQSMVVSPSRSTTMITPATSPAPAVRTSPFIFQSPTSRCDHGGTTTWSANSYYNTPGRTPYRQAEYSTSVPTEMQHNLAVSYRAAETNGKW